MRAVKMFAAKNSKLIMLSPLMISFQMRLPASGITIPNMTRYPHYAAKQV
jgi:hypothetical protein